MKLEDIRQICVTGAGQMGAQIAIQAALHGYRVTLHDIQGEALQKAVDGNRKHLERRVAKGKMSTEDVTAVFDRLHTTTSLEEACREADFVIEAVVEILDVKKQVFEQLDTFCPPHTILATNSSYLGSSEIAPVTGRPEKVVNMHFFYPPLVMQLVEVVKGAQTSDETVQLTAELAKAIGKQPVILHKELSGFLVNRILRALANEAYYLLENGVASFEDIDRACQLGLNHPMGPFMLGDFSGLDIGYEARLEKYRNGDESMKPPAALERRVLRGDLGRKTGRGFYDYSTNPPTPTED